MDEKHCCTCKQLKPLTEFNKLKRSKDGHQYSCRDCNKAYHYAHWDRHMAQIKARNRRRKEANRTFVADYLRAHPCVDCGETDLMVLEFDHLRDKVHNVGYLIATAEIWRVAAEIEKCEVVCANCHRRRTARRANSWRHRLLGEP